MIRQITLLLSCTGLIWYERACDNIRRLLPTRVFLIRLAKVNHDTLVWLASSSSAFVLSHFSAARGSFV
ncbi:hypothetical protein MKW98_004169 [Papaver atlanticum]|uniref:Uncharacterized protein n=1 Tax=Papaver atlanticum TaxID=357466 RepID=A0AAD4SZ60_9MAGN|nr:hypothetical protein MKW98_004169 [Papaver atlanticum]